MKPIAIFRHVEIEGPGYFSEFLDQRNIPWSLICIDEGADVPSDSADYSGLVFMGGPMSVNDDLPWIHRAEVLIRDAVSRDLPVMGHCLGGQLLSKALGGKVSRNPVKEIGWGAVTVSDNEIARHWFGEVKQFDAFHWHGETFSMPQGAVHLLSSEFCANQAWAIGKHLAMQCHFEMTAEMILSWSRVGALEIEASKTSPAVQAGSKMLSQTEAALPGLTKVATQLYGRWIEGVRS